MDAQEEGTRPAGEDAQTKSAIASPIPLDSARPAENAPAPSITQDTIHPPLSGSQKAVRFDLTQPATSVPFPSALLDLNGHLRTGPVPSVVLETKYDQARHPETRAYLIPLRELLSWHALKDVLANIREVRDNYPPIVYYKGTIVIGKYWEDIIHDGASFVVVYTFDPRFCDKAGIPSGKYWLTE